MLKIIGTVALILAVICVGLAQAGDNPDARAIAGIFYIPAIGLGAFGVVLWLLALL